MNDSKRLSEMSAAELRNVITVGVLTAHLGLLALGVVLFFTARFLLGIGAQ